MRRRALRSRTVQWVAAPQGDGTECLRFDDSLWSHADHIKFRYNWYKGLRQAIDDKEGGLDAFSEGYKIYGFNRAEVDGRPGIMYRAAPGVNHLVAASKYLLRYLSPPPPRSSRASAPPPPLASAGGGRGEARGARS